MNVKWSEQAASVAVGVVIPPVTTVLGLPVYMADEFVYPLPLTRRGYELLDRLTGGYSL